MSADVLPTVVKVLLALAAAVVVFLWLRRRWWASGEQAWAEVVATTAPQEPLGAGEVPGRAEGTFVTSDATKVPFATRDATKVPFSSGRSASSRGLAARRCCHAG